MMNIANFTQNIANNGVNSRSREISGRNRPVFIVKLKGCRFDFESGLAAFSDVNNTTGEAVSNKIIINFDRVENISVNALHSIVDVSDPSMSELKADDDPQSYADIASLNLNDYIDIGSRFLGKVAGFNPNIVNNVRQVSKGSVTFKDSMLNEVSSKAKYYTNSEESQEWEDTSKGIITDIYGSKLSANTVMRNISKDNRDDNLLNSIYKQSKAALGL